MKRRELMKHQRFAKRFVRAHNYQAGLFMRPGTGKTMPSIQLALEHEPPYLVICRRDDYLTWQLELKEEGVDEKSIYAIESGDDIPANMEGEVCQCGEDAIYHTQWTNHVFSPMYSYNWILVTWDLMRNPSIQDFVKSIDFTVVIGDELHSIKHYKAQRAKDSIKSTRHIPKRLGLTGTPIGNDMRDVWSQCLFIDDGKTFGDNEWKFLKKYYIEDKQVGGWYPKRESKHELRRLLETMSFSVHEDDVLKLPPPRSVIKSCPMSGMQRRLYDQVLEEWELSLLSDNHTIEINQVVVQLQKLKQIASGFIYDDEHTSRRLRCPKLDLLCDLVTDKDYAGDKPKIVVWCSQTDEILRISETFDNMKISNVKYYGGMKPGERREAREAFKGDPNLSKFIAQVDAGVGMNELIGADTAFYFSNSLKVLSRDQSMARTRRKGSEIHKEITTYDLITEGSVDIKIAKNIGKAMSLASYIVHGLKKGQPLKELI